MTDHKVGAEPAGERLPPDAAYRLWTAACAAAGWRVAIRSEQVPVAEALGRVTAADVLARWDSPIAACAAMDGIAIRADTDDRGWLHASSFQRVDTGDLVPAGLDTVVERERVEFGADGGARITGPAPRGLHVRAKGEDFGVGERLLPAGHRLRPADLAAAAAAGHAALAVATRPVAAIVPTGDEVRRAGSALRPGELIDSNSVMLAARAVQAGAQPTVSEIQPDDKAMIVAAVRQAVAAADVVLLIAGSSAGRGDHSAAVLAEVGGLTVSGAAIRPGHPVLLGYARRPAGHSAVPVIGVPGYPLAAAVTFEVFAVPLLAALLGARTDDRIHLRAELDCDWTSPVGTEDWVPVALSATSGGVLATPGRRGAGSTSRLMRADAWWTIPIGLGNFARGDQIDVQLLPGAPS